MKPHHFAWLVLPWLTPLSAATLRPEDFAAIHSVSSPRLAPDGSRIVYSVAAVDLGKDKSVSHLWLVNWDGSENREITFGPYSESNPAWSPDGRYLAFLSSRNDKGGDDPSQLWLLDLRGGEARQVTQSSGDISDFDWAPDGRQLVLVVQDPDPAHEDEDHEHEDGADRPPDADGKQREHHGSHDDHDDHAEPPIVISRYQFKQDVEGYLTERRSHLALLTLSALGVEGDVTPLTSGAHDDLMPAWSPDGKWIAFISKRGADQDRNDNWDIYLIDAKVGGEERQLTTDPEADALPDWQTRPEWSPDSRQLAFLHGGDPKLIEYATHGVAVIPVTGGKARMLATDLDRNIAAVRWADKGRALTVLIEQDRRSVLARIDVKTGKVDELGDHGKGTIGDYDSADNGRIALQMSTPANPDEIYAFDHGKPRPVSRQNEAFVAGVKLGRVEEIATRSADGNQTHGFITYPPDYIAGRAYPTLLYLHGGPAAQYEADFDFDAQLFAANGYVVLTMNPRGSTGRGTAYASAIYADWGNKDVSDVLGAVDDVVKRGIADPHKLVVGGWSYGGMLTNYTIASDPRFRAAVSGASISNVLAGYGTDEYIRDYDYELGSPWEHLDTWLHISYPFLHADRIKTPTLFMGGAEDYNVPVTNVQQMYQALSSLRVPTMLVIYPGQFHGLDRPSYIIDRWQRWLGWYEHWLKPAP